MRIQISRLKAEFGDKLTGKMDGVVEGRTAIKIVDAIREGKTVHVGSRSIGDCIALRDAGRMLAQTNSRYHGKCERAIYTN